MQWNEIDFRVRETKRPTGLKVHQDGFNPTNSLEWRSAVTSMMIDTNVNWMIPIEPSHEKNRYHGLVWKNNDIQDGATATIFRWRPQKGFPAKSSKTKLWAPRREWAVVKKEVQCGRCTNYYNYRSDGESRKRNAVQVECGSIDRIQCSEDERSVLIRKSCAQLLWAINEFPIPSSHGHARTWMPVVAIGGRIGQDSGRKRQSEEKQ